MKGCTENRLTSKPFRHPLGSPAPGRAPAAERSGAPRKTSACRPGTPARDGAESFANCHAGGDFRRADRLLLRHVERDLSGRLVLELSRGDRVSDVLVPQAQKAHDLADTVENDSRAEDEEEDCHAATMAEF